VMRLFKAWEKEADHLYRIIQSTVERKIFTLQQALDAYEVTRDEYDYSVNHCLCN
jgi:hypothetical protein